MNGRSYLIPHQFPQVDIDTFYVANSPHALLFSALIPRQLCRFSQMESQNSPAILPILPDKRPFVSDSNALRHKPFCYLPFKIEKRCSNDDVLLPRNANIHVNRVQIARQICHLCR